MCLNSELLETDWNQYLDTKILTMMKYITVQMSWAILLLQSKNFLKYSFSARSFYLSIYRGTLIFCLLNHLTLTIIQNKKST